MTLLPQASGNRPRLACEIFPASVVAGRSPEPGLPLAAVSRADLPEGAILPSLKPGNVANRVAVIAALRKVLEAAGARAAGRNGDLTLIIPDGAVRVLLLDFDSLPTKLSEALPIVRFRLKKLVPFDTDAAMVSFQVMSTTRSMVRVLAVAIPRDVLVEYESLVREAGFEPGAVLPSTLAAVSALHEGEGASLLVNAHALGVTTAIVRAGILLLHRAMELTEGPAPLPAGLPAELFEPSAPEGVLLPLVDREATEAEWAAQAPLPEFGRNPYSDRLSAEEANQDLDVLPAAPPNESLAAVLARAPYSGPIDMYAAAEPAPPASSPYASPLLGEELSTQSSGTPYQPAAGEAEIDRTEAFFGSPETGSRWAGASAEASEPPVHTLTPDLQAEEIARAVSVAVAYFEDHLAVPPEIVLSAGPLGAEALSTLLRESGVGAETGIRVRELVETESLAPGATTSSVPRAWLAGVTGALRS